jgi:hypothetical protein
VSIDITEILGAVKCLDDSLIGLSMTEEPLMAKERKAAGVSSSLSIQPASDTGDECFKLLS